MNKDRKDDWAPCLHGPGHKEEVGSWLLGILNKHPEFVKWKEKDIFLPDKHVPEREYEAESWKDGKPTGEKTTHIMEAHTLVRLNPKLTETLLWHLSNLYIPSGEKEFSPGRSKYSAIKLTFHADQWVGINAEAIVNGEEVSTWVEADDFTLALAKTLELWQEKAVTIE